MITYHNKPSGASMAKSLDAKEGFSMSKINERVLISVPDALKQVQIGRSLMYNAIKTRQIPSVRIGKRILIPADFINRLLAETEPKE